MTTYHEWAAYHAQMFGLLSEPEVAMVHAWLEPFTSVGYTVEELRAASDWMAINGPPKFRSEHLSGLTNRIRDRRMLDAAERTRKAMLVDPNDLGVCVNCFDVGIVTVPHFSVVRDGIWIQPFYTLGVLCGCNRGRKLQADRRVIEESKQAKDHHYRQRLGMTLEQYERKVPDWKRVMDDKQRTAEKFRVATVQANDMDKLLGEILKGIRSQEALHAGGR